MNTGQIFSIVIAFVSVFLSGFTLGVIAARRQLSS